MAGFIRRYLEMQSRLHKRQVENFSDNGDQVVYQSWDMNFPESLIRFWSFYNW